MKAVGSIFVTSIHFSQTFLFYFNFMIYYHTIRHRWYFCSIPASESWPGLMNWIVPYQLLAYKIRGQWWPFIAHLSIIALSESDQEMIGKHSDQDSWWLYEQVNHSSMPSEGQIWMSALKMARQRYMHVLSISGCRTNSYWETDLN